MIALRFENGPNAGLRIELDQERVVFGRDAYRADVVVRDSRASKRHCQLVRRGDKLLLVDMGSSNGTFIGGPGERQIAKPELLDIGDRFSVGPITFVVEAPGQTQKADATSLVMVQASDCVVVNQLETEGDPEALLLQHEGQARLRFLTGPHLDRFVFLGRRRVAIGRAEDNHCVLYDSLVAPHHALVVADGAHYTVRPLEGAEILHNARPVTTPTQLGHGDIMTVGASDIEFQSAGLDLDNDDPMSTLALTLPRYTFPGDVLVQAGLAIGRDPASDLFIDDRRVERQHARIDFEFPNFVLTDTSQSGTHVNGRRVAQYSLRDADTVQLGGYELRLRIQALRCSVEVVAPEAEPEAAGGFGTVQDADSPLMTLYRLPADRRHDESAGAADKDRSAVLWIEPKDVERTYRTPLSLAVAAVVSLLAAVYALGFADESLASGRQVSVAHSSEQFLVQAKATTGDSSRCGSCHVSDRPVVAACTGCHETPAVRPAHAEIEGDCSQCHGEHAASNPANVNERCSGCHADRHAALLPVDPGVFTATAAPRFVYLGRAIDLKADLSFDPEERSDRLHAAHRAVKGRCASCHMTQAGEERDAESMGRSCFGCHASQDALRSQACAQCHREHGDTWSLPKNERVATASAWPAALGFAGVLCFALLLSIGLHHGLRRKGDDDETDAPAAPTPQTDGVVACGGTALGRARKLPRLSPNRCTGSGDCADACPYDVLHMEQGRPQVLRPELCHECGTCVAVCGPGALSMAVPGEPPPMISVPSLDANFQTGLGDADEGIYVIGEAAGKPLVKNANNLGRWVVDHMVFEGIQKGSAAAAGLDLELVIVGSGPAGLSAALTAEKHGLQYVLLEKGPLPTMTVRGYPKKKRLMATPVDVENRGPLPVWDTSREELLSAWDTTLKEQPLKIAPHSTIQSVEALDMGFKVVGKTGTWTTLRLVLAVGTRGDPRRLNKPGDDLDKVVYRLDDPASYKDQDLMVVGGGDSAIEAACALAAVHGGSNRVTIVYRRDKFTRAKAKNREMIERQIADGTIKAFLQTSPVEIKEDSVLLAVEGQGEQLVDNHVVFCMLGANPPTQWLERIGIEITQKPSDWDPGRSDQFAFENFAEDAS